MQFSNPRKVPPSANLSVRVRGVDQPRGVSLAKGPDADGDPPSEEDDEEEEAEDVGAAAVLDGAAELGLEAVAVAVLGDVVVVLLVLGGLELVGVVDGLHLAVAAAHDDVSMCARVRPSEVSLETVNL